MAKEEEDRISKLPVHIIHEILRLIRQHGLEEEARTCVLSKTWNLIWRSRPDVILQSTHFRNLEDFVKFVDDSLRLYVRQNLRIETLCLKQLHPRELPCHSHVDRWLELAVKLNLRFLEIDAAWFGFKYYTIPDSIYAAKTLTVLYLSGCNFGIDNSTTNKLQGLISTCSFIKDLKLSHCTGFKNLNVLGLVNLEKLEIARCKKLDKRPDSYNLTYGDGFTRLYNHPQYFIARSILIYEAPRTLTRKLDLYNQNTKMRLKSFVKDMTCAQPKIISIMHEIDSKILQVFHETTAAYKKQNRRLEEVTNHKGAAEDGGTSQLCTWLKYQSQSRNSRDYHF
ncbi:hypothetical protein HAX54_044354 [Datura stramonium]|uniref:Uncharacterized protein n=1 Tax=Datura stramonium TaxID=4076 RepID=A0ABS8W2I4_DATST|nr:hypothetical protein [Datura stramonium]